MSDITLIHSGSGDTVAGDKVINAVTYQEIITAATPDSLRKPVRAILDEINNREFNSAIEKIKLIESMSGLKSEVIELLTILKIKCEHTSNPKSELDLKEIISTLRTSSNELIKDLALSLILSVESQTKGLDKAKERFSQSKDVGLHSKAVALAIFSTKEELLDLLHNEINNISEEEINGMIEGMIRLNCFVEAHSAAEHLKENFENYNSNYLSVLTTAFLLNESINKKDYWLLTQSEKEKVDNLSQKALLLYKESESCDPRLFNILFPSLIFTKLSNKEHLEICKLNIDKTDIFAKEYADELKVLCRTGEVSDNHPTKIVENLISNEQDRQQKITSILESKEVDYSTFWIAQQVIPEEKFKSWIDNGVTITGDFNELEIKLNELRVALLSSKTSKVEECIESLLKTPKPDNEVINAEYIKSISENLYNCGNEEEACDLLLYFLNDKKELWCSPLVEYTLYKLHNTARHKDLISLSNRVNDKDKPIEIHNLIIWTHLFHGSALDALAEAEKDNNNNDIQKLSLTLKALYKLEKFECIDKTISEIDITLFANPEPVTLDVISIIVNRAHFELVENIVINWFKDSLDDNYFYISQACIQIITSDKVQNFNPSYKINGLEHAIQYRDGDKSILKIIANDEKLSNRHILSPNSILAKAFKDKEVGDEIISGVKHLTLERLLPPFIAIKDLASNIRDESNDGSDAFQIFKISEDPAIMIEQFSKYLPLNKIDDSLFTNKALPLAVRMNLINKSDPIKSAMMLLENPKTQFEALINDGGNIESDACTDIITILYLCLTSTSEYFIKNGIRLYLTQDDIDVFTRWIKSVENDKYGTISKDESGTLHFVDSEKFKRWNSNLLSNLKAILPILKPLNIIPDNYAKQLAENIDIYGYGYVKSIYAIKNSSIPMFSIDTHSCRLLFAHFQMTPLNPYKIIDEAASKFSKSQRDHAIFLHAINGLPFPIKITDFYDLAASRTDLEGHILRGLLNKYIGSYNPELNVSEFLSRVLERYIIKSIKAYVAPYPFRNLHLTFFHNQYGPKVDRIFNLCCSSVIQHKLGSFDSCAEEKMADFFVKLGEVFLLQPRALDFLSELYLQYLEGRFLDINEVNKNITRKIDALYYR